MIPEEYFALVNTLEFYLIICLYSRASEPVWEHERQQLIDMNKQPPSFKLLTTSKLEKDVQIYKQWKLDREKRLGEMDEKKRLEE